jgi:hypothetical protein
MRGQWIEKASPVVVWAVRLIGWMFSGVVAAVPVIKGLPLEWVAFFAFSGLTLAVMLSYYAFLLGDYIYENFAHDPYMGRAFAAHLVDRISVGQTSMTTLDAADTWAKLEGYGRDDQRHNTRFRWIKVAVDRGHVVGENLNPVGNANKDSIIDVQDLADFLRRRNWRKLLDPK